VSYCEKCIRQEVCPPEGRRNTTKGRVTKETATEFVKRVDQVEEFLSELSQLPYEPVSIRRARLDWRRKMGITRTRLSRTGKRNTFHLSKLFIQELGGVFKLKLSQKDREWTCCKNRVRKLDLKRYCMIREGEFEKGQKKTGTR
jgi:hypothetical protein